MTQNYNTDVAPAFVSITWHFSQYVEHLVLQCVMFLKVLVLESPKLPSSVRMQIVCLYILLYTQSKLLNLLLNHI